VTNRRDFLKNGSLAAIAASGLLPQLLRAEGFATRIDATPRAGDSDLRALAMRALDAAKAAGASYADVRLTVTRTQAFYYANPPVDSEEIAVGVRALANGAWGFTASPEWTPDVLSRLGHEAAAQAKGNAWPGRAAIELAARPAAGEGTWRMPVQRDPFSVSVEEKLDYIRSAEAYARTFRNGSASSIIIFDRQESTFASTDGAFYTQTIYNSLGHGSFFSVSASDPVKPIGAGRAAPMISPTGAGYEVFVDADLLAQVPKLYEQARELLLAKPLEAPSRYDVVFDAHAMAGIIDGTFGPALELDRALGLEANASGTSYLAPIDKILGSSVGSPLVTLTGDRAMAGGAATVQWDADGVAPSTFKLIDKGVAVDYATSRDHAPTLADWYKSKGRTMGSNGCATAEDGMSVPCVQAPNLTLEPAANNRSFQDLVSGIDDGLAVIGGNVMMDQQQLNGQGLGEMVYRIRKGKITGTVSSIAYLFRAPEFWKNLVALGGASTADTRGMTVHKGQPRQETVHTVKAVAAHFKNVPVSIISTERRRGPGATINMGAE
jgi:TldD protein